MLQNNHYIPQLILRRFGNKLNRYNVKNGTFVYKRSNLNAFSEKGLYPDELETKLAFLESKIANLIDKKILNADKDVVLTRDDLWLIKKFFTIAAIRVPSSYGLRYIDSKKQSEDMGFKEIEIPGETEKEYIFRTIDVVIESNNISDIYNNPKVTFEACKWAMLFNCCYLTIWDSKDANEDFVITDNGMNCEHDKSRFITFPNLCGKGPYKNERDEMIKKGYLYCKIEEDAKNKRNLNLNKYLQIEERMRHVHANYYLFAVSNNRTISLVNPFFRLYFDESFIKCETDKPNVWPTKISPYALETNKVTYVKKNEFNSEDEFTYEVKSLPLRDVLLVNCLMLDRVDTWLGFDETAKIIRTLSVYNLINYKRNNYDKLVLELNNYGYELHKSSKYKALAQYMTEPNFTFEEIKYIEYFYNLILKYK